MRINFEIRIPTQFSDAAIRAVARWNKETESKLGLKLTTTRPWLTLRKPKLHNKRNEIYFAEITTDERWAECRRNWHLTTKELNEADIVLDQSKPYDVEGVYKVVLHELGHALGLEHSDETDAMMNARGPAYLSDLTQADIKALKKLYQRK